MVLGLLVGWAKLSPFSYSFSFSPFSFLLFFLFLPTSCCYKASPCSPRRPPRRRLAMPTGSLAVPRLNALITMVVQCEAKLKNLPLLFQIKLPSSCLCYYSLFLIRNYNLYLFLCQVKWIIHHCQDSSVAAFLLKFINLLFGPAIIDNRITGRDYRYDDAIQVSAFYLSMLWY